MTKVKHVHLLRRHVFHSGNKQFFCTLPDCNYKVKTALALGKQSICNRCGKPFIMNEYSIRLAKPHCNDCHKSKDGKQVLIPGESSTNDGTPISMITVPLSLAERLKKAANREEEEEI